MTEPIEFHPRTQRADPEPVSAVRAVPAGIPSNEVYARVGDAVLSMAQDGVRRGLTPQDIIHEIHGTYGVRLSVGELRLLLASRRL